MSEVNGITKGPLELSLVCFLLCIMFTPLDALRGTLIVEEISAFEGRTVIISCPIKNFSPEKLVSWIRIRDIHILTSGSQKFSSDPRFEPVHYYLDSGDFWGLKIDKVTVTDSGQYECQINSEPKMSFVFQLTIFESNATSHTSMAVGRSSKASEKTKLFISPFAKLLLLFLLTIHL